MDFLTDGPESSERTFLFAHGAGGAMDTPFMTEFAERVGASGIRVARFEFPYMARRRMDGRRGAPDREPVLLDSWREAIAACGDAAVLVIGGKSMGGRMATIVADEFPLSGVVCLGYPFHPPAKPQKLRTSHLRTLRTPTLIVQGTRDQFGTREEVGTYELSSAIRVEWIEDGDHSLKPRARGPLSPAAARNRAIALVTGFVQSL